MRLEQLVQTRIIRISDPRRVDPDEQALPLRRAQQGHRPNAPPGIPDQPFQGRHELSRQPTHRGAGDGGRVVVDGEPRTGV